MIRSSIDQVESSFTEEGYIEVSRGEAKSAATPDIFSEEFLVRRALLQALESSRWSRRWGYCSNIRRTWRQCGREERG
jgi:hypothetical protein